MVKLRQAIEDDAEPKTLEDLARRVSPPPPAEPFSLQAVHRFLIDETKGKKTRPLRTAELATALARLYGIPDPILPPAAPEEAEWFWLGRDFLRLAPDDFRKMLVSVRKIVDGEREKEEINKKRG